MKNKLNILLVLSTLILSNANLMAQEEDSKAKGYVVQGRVADVTLLNENEENTDDPDIEIEIPTSPSESRLWLDFFQENGQLLTFGILADWETIDDTAILSNRNVATYDPTDSENVIEVPQGNLGISSLYNLDFSNNNLTNVDFLVSLSEIRGDINFENNSIRDLNGMYFVRNISGNAYFHNNQINSAINLLNVQSVGGELTLYNNPQLKSIYGLRSITSGTVRLDNPSQYERKVDFYSDFCQSFDDGAIEVYEGATNTRLTKVEVCEEDPWLVFFQTNGQLTNFSALAEWESEEDFSIANVDNLNINNFDLPSFPFIIKSLYELNVSNNELTTLGFLENITNVRGNLTANDNFIRELDKLSNLTVIEGDLNLANNSLRKLNGLENLTDVDRLFINDNPITSLEPIQELFRVKDIYIDEPLQYTKIDYKTPLCTAFINNVLDIVIQDTGLSAEKEVICEGLPDFSEWLDFFQAYGQLEDLNSIFDWILFDDFANISNQGISNNTFIDLPETMGVYSIFGLDASGNDLTNVNFLGSLREVRTNLYLQSNNLIFVSGLSQLETVKVLDLSKNNNLNDIRGLANIASATRIVLDSPTQYVQKPVYSSAFCQGLNTGNVLATTVDSVALTAYDLCSEIPDDEQWRLFFNKNNQFTESDTLSSWVTSNITVRINRNYPNSEFPSVVMPVPGIYDLLLNSNQLTNVNFLSEVTLVIGELNLSNNNLNNISGLSNITEAKILDLSDNNLGTLNDLNLETVETLDISDNRNLVNLSGLNNLLTATRVYIDNPAQYTIKPNVNSQFCLGVESGAITVLNSSNQLVTHASLCEGSTENSATWLYYFQSNNQLLELNELSAWADSGLGVELNFESISNRNVPGVSMGVSEIGSLDFSNNNFNNFDFMRGINHVKGDLLLNSNFGQNVSNLISLRIVDGKLDLSNNAFTAKALNEGSSLQYIRDVKEIAVYGNQFVEDVKGLKNIQGRTPEDPTIIRIDNPSQYRSNYFSNRREQVPEPDKRDMRILLPLPYYQPLCLGLIRGNSELYIGGGSTRGRISDICEGVPENEAWLEFFNVNGFLTSFSLLDQWESQDEVVDLSSSNLSNSDLPSGTMQLTSLFELDMSDNNLESIAFMGFVEGVRGNLDFSNNNITSLRGLEDIRFVTGEIKLYGNDYDSLEYIQNLSSATALRIDNPPENEKLEYALPLCQAIENGNVLAYIGEDTVPLPLSRICYTADTDPNTAWLNFFKANGELTSFINLKEWENSEVLADVSGLSLTNGSIPSSLMRITSLGSLDFSNNDLANAFFLNNITQVGGTINLSENRLSNFGAVGNLTTAGNVILNGNSNVVSIQPLENIASANNVTIDSPTQYTEKPNFDTTFCEAVKRLNVRVFDTTRRLSIKDVCSNVSTEDQWLNFFQAEHNTLLNPKLNELSEWNLKNGVASIIGEQEINNSVFPTNPLPAPSVFAIEISGQQINNVNFLSQVTEVRSRLILADNVISDISGLSNITSAIPTLNLSGNQLTSVALLSGVTFNDLDLSRNQLVDANGLDFVSINNLNLEENQLTNINALLTLETINNELRIVNNIDLTDITGIQNINSGIVVVDNPVQYTTKPDFSTPFCQAILSNNVTVNIVTGDRLYVEDVCINVSEQGLWLSYFHKQGRLLEIGDINDWLTEAAIADLPNRNISNNDLPAGQIDVASLFTLDFANNSLDNVDFLTGLTEVRGSLRLNNNPLISTTGLADIRDVIGDLLLNDTNLTSTQDLIRLRNVGSIDLAGNDNLIDLSGLENIEFASAVYLNAPVQYDLMDFTSPFCFGVSRGEVVPIVKNAASQRILITDICDGVPNEARWLNYLQVNGQLLGFTEMADWETLNTFATLANQGLNNGEIPSARMITTGVYSFDMSNNALRNISFLALVTDVREELNFNNNIIDNIGGLGRLVNIKTLKLANNNIEDLDRMEAIETIQYLDLSNNPLLNDIGALRGVTGTTYLDLNTTAVRNLVPIADFSSLTYLDISNTPLTDITPLADLSINTVKIPDPVQIETKPDFATSTFCQDYYTGVTTVTYNDIEVYVADICANVPANIAWLDFFRRNGQLTNFTVFDDWLTTNTAANVSVRSIVDGRLPPISFGLNSIYTLNMSQNNLTNVDFLIDVETQRQHLYLQNNQITDFTGLNGLTSIVNTLDVSNNQMVNFNPINLNSVGTLMINENSLLETIGFDSLTAINTDLEILNNPLLTTIDLPLVTDLNTVEISGNTNLTTINNPSLANINGIFLLEDNAGLTSFSTNGASFLANATINNNNVMDTLTVDGSNFSGNLSITNNNNLTTFNQSSIGNVNGEYLFNNNNGVTSLGLNSSGTFGRSITITNNDLLQDFTIGTIPSLGRSVVVENNAVLTNVTIEDIQNQVTAGWGLIIRNNPSLTDIDIQRSRFIRGNLVVSPNPSLKNVTVGSVERAYNQFLINNIDTLETITLGTIDRIDNQLRMDGNAALTTINIDTIGDARNIVNASNNPLLTSFVANDMNVLNSSLNLSNNPALTTLDLGLTSTINLDFNLVGSTALSDVTGLSNLSRIVRNFDIETPSQYTTRPDYNVPFCIAITASDIIPEHNNGFVSITNLCNNVPNHALWMDIFHSYGEMRDADTIFDWELPTNTSTVDISGNGLSEGDFPAFPLDSTKIYIFNISNNQFTQLDILSNLQEIRHSFIANNNLINDITNLLNITRVERKLDLSNNRLISLNGLSNITYVGEELSLYGNNSLLDISGLANIAFAPRIELDSPEQYLTVMPATSPFCQALVRQDVKVYVGETNEKVAMRFLCNDSDSQDLWLNLFHTYDQLLSFSNINNWQTGTNTADISSNNLGTPDLPVDPMATTSIHSLLINDNVVANADFMSNVTSVRNTLNLNDNQINNVIGLSGVTNYINLYLRNNMITDVAPLDGITSGLVNIDLSFNDILRVPDLTSFADLNNVYFNSNINLNDISGLSALRTVNQLYLNGTDITDITPLRNLVSANEIRFDDPTGVIPKLEYTDSFCDGIKNDIILPYFSGSLIDIRNLCQNFPDDYLWLLFFRDNGQVTNYNDISEWQSNNGIVSITGSNLQNQDLPPNLIGVTSLYTLNMNNNFIDNLGFMTEVTTIRETINFSNNSLTDVSGLSALISAKNIYLNDNPNLGSIAALTNLSTINNLNLSNTGRDSYAGLESLTSVTGTLDMRNNPLLTDVSFLNQITTANAIQLDDPVQYTKVDYDTSPVCERINTGVVKIYNNAERLSADAICAQAPSEFDWLAFFKTYDINNAFGSYFTLQQWNTTNTSANISGLNIQPADLPLTGSLGVSSIYSINMENNQIDTVDWLTGVTNVRNSLNLSRNAIVNLNGTEGVTSMIRSLDISDNQLVNIDGLQNFTRMGDSNHQTRRPYSTTRQSGRPGVTETFIDLRNNPNLTNIDGLQSLTTLTYANLLINNNPSLTDISGLRNLSNVTYFSHSHCDANNPNTGNCYFYTQNHFHYVFVDDPVQYTTKPEITSNFCVAVKNSNVRVLRGSDNSRIEAAPLCNITDEWLALVHSTGQALWTLSPTEADTTTHDYDLSGIGLTDSNVPQVNMEWTTPYTLRLNDNTLTNVDFMTNVTRIRNALTLQNNNLENVNGMINITNAHAINLSYNNLNDISGLLSLTNITSELRLHDNPTLLDITGIENIANTNGSRIVIDNQTQYTTKPLIETPLCQGLVNGVVRIEIFDSEEGTYIPVNDRVFCDASQAWLDFFQTNGQALALTSIFELNNQTTPLDVSGNALADADRPNGALNIQRLLNLNFSNNLQTEVGYLFGIEELIGDLNYSNNNITDIGGFDLLNTVGGNLLLNDNNISDLNELSALRNVGGDLDISGNSNLTNIEAIGGILSVGGTILIDEPAQFTVKPDVSTSFCNLIANDTLIVNVKETGRNVDVNELCSTTDEWLGFFHQQAVLLDNLVISDWNTDSINIDISNRGLSNAQVPSSNINLTEVYGFNVSDNNLTDINFMSQITRADDLSFIKNNLSNINGLANLTNVTKVIAIQENRNVTDLSQIGNLVEGTVYINNPAQYTTKPNVSTDFCNAILNTTIQPSDIEDGQEILRIGDVCSTTNIWLTYFYQQGVMNDYAYMTDMETQPVVIDLSEKSLTDASLPNALWNVNSIYDVNLKSNSLTDIDFLAGVSSIRESLDVSLNGLRNLNGLFSVTIAKDLFFNGNDLTDISGLINLTELTGFLYLTGNPNLTNISFLETLQRNNSLYPIYLDDPIQYTTKPVIGSNFCQALDSGMLTVIGLVNGTQPEDEGVVATPLTSTELCQ